MRRREIEAAKADLGALVDEKLATEREVYIRERLAGFVLLGVGVPLVFVANFVD